MIMANDVVILDIYDRDIKLFWRDPAWPHRFHAHCSGQRNIKCRSVALSFGIKPKCGRRAAPQWSCESQVLAGCGNSDPNK